jgi:hypothetical protein
MYLFSKKPFAIIQKIDTESAGAGRGNRTPTRLSALRILRAKPHNSILHVFFYLQ